MDVPVIDPNVEYIGITNLRKLTLRQLRGLDKLLAVVQGSKTLAVVMRYDLYMQVQKDLQAQYVRAARSCLHSRLDSELFCLNCGSDRRGCIY